MLCSHSSATVLSLPAGQLSRVFVNERLSDERINAGQAQGEANRRTLSPGYILGERRAMAAALAHLQLFGCHHRRPVPLAAAFCRPLAGAAKPIRVTSGAAARNHIPRMASLKEPSLPRSRNGGGPGRSTPSSGVGNVGRNADAKGKRDLVDVESDERIEPLLSTQEGVSGGDSYTLSAIILPFLFPALGGLLFGYDIGATSGAVLSLTSAEFSGTSWYGLSSIETGFVVSGSLYGALPGSILAFNIADFLGRRGELLVSAVTYALGAVMTSLAPSLSVLIAGRFVYGVSIGLAMHAAPLYISETAPPKIRGTMVALKEGLIVAGILFGYLVGSLTIEVMGGWRIMYGSAAPIAVLMGLGLWWLPASPRWLLLRAVQGKAVLKEAKEKAKVAFSKLRGKIVTEPSIQAELEETLASAETCTGQDEITFSEIFQGKLNQKAFVIGGGLVFLQQVTGQPSVLYYAAQILQSAGFSAAGDATKVSVILGLFKLLLTGVAIFYVDKVGRRPLLLTGVTGIVVSLLALAAYYSFASGIPFLAVGALLLYVGSYQVSFGPISWLMVSEVFPLRSRGRAMSLTTLVNFGSNAVVAFSFAPIQDLVGASATFLIFALIAVAALVFVATRVPETKGLTLEEIEVKLSE